jgi:hypothetical protein
MIRLMRLMRNVLIVLAVTVDLFSLFLAATSLPEADRNPASPEFGALQWQWAVAFVLALLLMGSAILVASGSIRRWLLALLLLTLFLSIEPATHLYKYRIKPRFGADGGRHERTVIGVIAGRGNWQEPAKLVMLCPNA